MKRNLKTWICLPILIFIMIISEIGVLATNENVSLININADIEAYVREHEETTAAVSIAVFQNSETIHLGYYGEVNKEQGLNNSHDMVMEWGSITKLLVWVSVMQLVELEKLDLNQDIKHYLPNDFIIDLKYDQPITMMNLMHHNAGFEDQLIDLFKPIDEDVDNLETVLKHSIPNQLYYPGEVVAYSNWGTGLAAYLVEVISGMSFSEYVHDNIFKPLSMEHTAILPTLSDNDWVNNQRNLVNSYTTNLTEMGVSRYQIPLYPSGMATGTLEDLLRFGKALVPNENEQSELFESRETLDQFLTPTLFYNDKNSTPRNAHGLWLDKTDILTFGHGGNTIGASANLQFDPISGIGIIVMSNQSGESVYNIGIQEMVFGQYPLADVAFESVDISGVYSQSRTIRHGGLRIYDFLLTMPIFSSSQGSFNVPLMGIQITQIDTDRIILDYGTVEGIGYIRKNNDETITLEVGVQDYIYKNTILFVFEVFLFLFLFLSFMYSVYSVFSILVQKKKRKLWKSTKNERLLLSVGNIALIITYIYVVLNALNFESANNIRMGLMICTFIMIWISIAIVKALSTFRKSNQFDRSMFLTIIAGVVMLMNSLYWQWFMFW